MYLIVLRCVHALYVFLMISLFQGKRLVPRLWFKEKANRHKKETMVDIFYWNFIQFSKIHVHKASKGSYSLLYTL